MTLQIVVSLIDAAGGVIYDRRMFIVQALVIEKWLKMVIEVEHLLKQFFSFNFIFFLIFNEICQIKV